MKIFSLFSAHSLVLLLCAGGLTACGSGPDSDLLVYVEKVKQSSPPPAVEKIINKKHELFAYQADSEGIRDPFVSTLASVIVRQAPAKGLAPDGHKAGLLETMPLDSLVYMGSIEKRGRRVALVRSSDGKVHQVRIGSYLGQNHGKVVEFNPQQITLQELVADGLGGWQTRTARIGQAK